MNALGDPRNGWWGYVKHMVRRYPHMVSEEERRAVDLTLKETAQMYAAEERLKIIRLVLMKGSHTVAGAAVQIPCSESTAQRYHGDFLRAVARKFRCDGLPER